MKVGEDSNEMAVLASVQSAKMHYYLDEVSLDLEGRQIQIGSCIPGRESEIRGYVQGCYHMFCELATPAL